MRMDSVHESGHGHLVYETGYMFTTLHVTGVYPTPVWA